MVQKVLFIKLFEILNVYLLYFQDFKDSKTLCDLGPLDATGHCASLETPEK